MGAAIFWSSRDWAAAVAALPAPGPLPSRTVLVPRERVAHSLRRELIRSDRTDVLAGTRFVIMPLAAVEVLRAAGAAFEPGEETLRRARLLAVFGAGVPLKHFSLDLLRSKLGWDDAFARTITDLEGAGLRADDLEGTNHSERLRDLAAVWRALDSSAGCSWTTPRIYREAAVALGNDPGVWPYPGAVLAFAGGDLTAAEAQFIRAIPDVRLGLLASRPARRHYLDRMQALLGEQVGEALRAAEAPRSAASERDLLASYLFEPPTILAAESRPRSNGPDETVDLEEHAGVEAEVEATAVWVARQIGLGTPLEDIAVLVPVLDPLAGLVAARLGRLPWQEGYLPVHVAGGLPLSGSAGGTRALAVVRALQAHLSAESLAAVLPTLRSPEPEGRHLSHGAATDLVWSLGTVGGNPARPNGALEWSPRVEEREVEIAEQLARARAVEAEADSSGLARKARDFERLLADLGTVRPAIEALIGVAQHVVGGAKLDTLWPVIQTFLRDWLLQPGEGPRADALAEEQLSALAADSACGSLAGDDALRVIEEAICSTRVSQGRFGEPAVYVGTVRDAVGLRFRGVRVIGLAEGHLPSLSREDPVVPDALRRSLSAGAAPPTAVDRALEELHALDIVIRSTEERIALSAPRLDAERSQREPSSVILEAAAALGRPNRVTGERAGAIPDSAALRRDSFAPARERAASFRLERPLGEAAWLDGVADGALGIPPRWRVKGVLDLNHARPLLSPREAGPLDGILGDALVGLPVPGLTADRPISPSDLATLLNCPYAFLLGDLLGFEEPAAPPPRREIGQPAYGELFHAVAAEFYSRHGASFCAHEGTLSDWLARADEVVERAYVAFLKQYPLVGDAVRAQQRERLRRDLHELLHYDWEATEGRFVGVERVFGRPTPVRLELGDGRALYLRGRIDRLDAEGQRLLVRDLKTGRAHPRIGREQSPDPGLDLQIAVYGLVARMLAPEWEAPDRVAAAYAYIGRGGTDERAFRDDFDEILEPEGRRWLGVAAALLAARHFPRTPNTKDCEYCSFRPVCGDSAQVCAAELLVGATGALAEFAALKGAAGDKAE